MVIAAVLFLVSALGAGRRRYVGDHHHRALHRRRRRRRGQRAVAGLHQRSHAGQHARPAVERAAGHDHHRPDRRIPRQLFPGALGRQVARRRSGWVIRPGAGCSGCRSFRRRSISSRCCSSPRARAILVASGRDEEARTVLTRLFGARRGGAQGAEIHASLAADHIAAAVRSDRQEDRPHAQRSSGSASGSPLFSSWSASTSCSTTARCCGRRWASARTIR